MTSEATPMRMDVKHWKLEKFDGDPPQPGEHKLPLEVIEGGDGLPTTHRYPQREAAAALASL